MYTANTAEAKTVKEQPDLYAKALGSRGRVFKPHIRSTRMRGTNG